MKKTKLTKALPVILLSAIFLITINACKNKQQQAAGQFKIDLHLAALPNDTVIFQEVQPDSFTALDTVITDGSGVATLTINQPEAGIYFLALGNNRIITLSIPGETVVYSSNRPDLSDLTATGSAQNAGFLKYQHDYDSLRRIVDTLSICLDKAKHRDDYPEVRDSVGMIYTKVFSAQQQLTLRYLQQNPSSLGALIALNQRSGPRPLFNVDEHLGLMMTVDSNLRKAHPNNKHVTFLHKNLTDQIKRIQNRASLSNRLQPGNPAPDIVMKGGDGDDFKLSELKGKVILLHFWASWSTGYRKDFGQIHNIAQKYAPLGLDIVSVSFDNKRYQWMQAINFDSMKWTQLCDLLYPDSPIQKLYAVGDNLPTYYLIDQNGLIFGRYDNAGDVSEALKTMKWK